LTHIPTIFFLSFRHLAHNRFKTFGAKTCISVRLFVVFLITAMVGKNKAFVAIVSFIAVRAYALVNFTATSTTEKEFHN
jgi:hypothetical protein